MLFTVDCCFWFVIDLVGRIRYEKYHGYYGGEEEERKNNYTDMVRQLISRPILSVDSAVFMLAVLSCV